MISIALACAVMSASKANEATCSLDERCVHQARARTRARARARARARVKGEGWGESCLGQRGVGTWCIHKPLTKHVWSKDNAKIARGHEVVFDVVRM